MLWPQAILSLLLTCLAVRVLSGVVEDKYSCPHGWTRYGNRKCLKYVNELQDYERAQATCRQKNQGTLVTIHSHEEQNFVYSYIHSIAASSTPIWLGAKQIDFESILWLDKTENSYVNWAPSEPSHPDEICIAINPRTGMWHDVMCTEANVPACERAPTTQWPFFVAFCSEGWFQFNDEKCVRIISSQALNFYESQELCRSKYNSKLLSIKADKESEFIHNLIKFRDVKLPVWLGAVQNDFSSFSWLDKSDITFTNWAEGEPNDPDHACISMQASGGKWSDNDCKEQKLILCQKVVPEDGACETGWLQFRQDKCYRFVHVRLAFDDAEMLCNNLYSGHLPSIHSQEEQFMISQFLASVNVKNGSEIWLGARQMDFHNFNWGDGSQFNYSYWEQGEPSFPAEKCIEMSWRNGRWNDINCRLKRAVLCERQVASRHHIKPNLYQPTTCLNLEPNCSQPIGGAQSNTAATLLGAQAAPADQTGGTQQQAVESQPVPTLEATGTANSSSGTGSQVELLLSNKSNVSNLPESIVPLSIVANQQQASNVMLPAADSRQPATKVTSMMSRSDAKPQAATVGEHLLVANGSTTTAEQQANSSNVTSTVLPFILYNLPPPDHVFSAKVGSAAGQQPQNEDTSSLLQAKKGAPDEQSSNGVRTPEYNLQQKNSPPAPIEQMVKQIGDSSDVPSANASSLLDKIKTTTIATTTITGAPTTQTLPSSGFMTGAAAQEFANTTSVSKGPGTTTIESQLQTKESQQTNTNNNDKQ